MARTIHRGNGCCVQVTQLELHIYMYLKKKTWLDGISKILLKENEDGDKEELSRKKFLVERINDTKNQKMNKRILCN